LKEKYGLPMAAGIVAAGFVTNPTLLVQPIIRHAVQPLFIAPFVVAAKLWRTVRGKANEPLDMDEVIANAKVFWPKYLAAWDKYVDDNKLDADPKGANMKIKGVVPFKETAKADQGEAWDANAAVERLRKWAGVDAENPSDAAWKKYADGFTWFGGEGNKLGDFKMPHHDVKNGKLVVVFRGVAAGMAVINGGRGGVNLPSVDKEKVYNHLAKHYKQFDQEPPEMKSAGQRWLSAKVLERIYLQAAGLKDLADSALGTVSAPSGGTDSGQTSQTSDSFTGNQSGEQEDSSPQEMVQDAVELLDEALEDAALPEGARAVIQSLRNDLAGANSSDLLADALEDFIEVLASWGAAINQACQRYLLEAQALAQQAANAMANAANAQPATGTGGSPAQPMLTNHRPLGRKSGRVLSSKNADRIQTAHKALSDVIQEHQSSMAAGENQPLNDSVIMDSVSRNMNNLACKLISALLLDKAGGLSDGVLESLREAVTAERAGREEKALSRLVAVD
jgi:hypothetical protein